MAVLVVVEHDCTAVRRSTLHAVTAARDISLFLDGQVDLLVVGAPRRLVAQQAALVRGVCQVVWAYTPGPPPDPDGAAMQVLALAGSYSHVVLAASGWGRAVASRVAAGLAAAPIEGITGVVGADTFERPATAGGTTQVVRSADATTLITVCPAAFEATPVEGGSATVQVRATYREAPGKEAVVAA